MRLSELNPEWYPPTATSATDALAIRYDCPGCKGSERAHRLFSPLALNNATGTAWTHTGASFEDLSFVDAPRGSRSVRVMGYPCHSHFNITAGAIEHYGDSKSP